MRNGDPIGSESDLREWLRQNWQDGRWGPLIWVEAARGGTDGAPDVFVPGSFGFVPVELKHWEYSPKGHLAYNIRPTQKRMHRLIVECRHPSAFLVSTNRNEIFLVPSKSLQGIASSEDRIRIARILKRYPISTVAELSGLVRKGSFFLGER